MNTAILIIILIVCFIIGLICWDTLTENDRKKDKYAFGLWMASWLITSIIVTLISQCYRQPNAIDVYRGNTKLEITKKVINDSVVKCDSIVVFKK